MEYTKSRRAPAGVALENRGRDSIRRCRSPKLRLRVAQVGGSAKACARTVAPAGSGFQATARAFAKAFAFHEYRTFLYVYNVNDLFKKTL